MSKILSGTWMIGVLVVILALTACKSKKSLQATPTAAAVEDTSNGKCRLNFKTAKNLSKHLKENEFNFDWINIKADATVKINDEENSLDIRIKARKDSVIWISIQALSLVDVAKVLITRDTVKMVVYQGQKGYFIGDFNYINDLLQTDLDFDMLQAVLFGNSAEFYDEDDRLKPLADRENCRYLLSTERKRKLKKIINGQEPPTKSTQIMVLNPDNYKILQNTFTDIETNRTFRANYDQFVTTDSVYAPRHVDIDIAAEKKVSVKIDYVRMELGKPQKITLNIPSKYAPLPVKKQQ